jgi:hypothetical protein
MKRTTGDKLATDVTLLCFGRRLPRFWFRAAYAAYWAIETGQEIAYRGFRATEVYSAWIAIISDWTPIILSTRLLL